MSGCDLLFFTKQTVTNLLWVRYQSQHTLSAYPDTAGYGAETRLPDMHQKWCVVAFSINIALYSVNWSGWRGTCRCMQGLVKPKMAAFQVTGVDPVACNQ